MSKTMKAVVFRKYGGIEVLEHAELPQSTPAPGKILIRVAAAGVNPSDALFRSGALKMFLRLKMPFIPGLDVAGIVENAGDSASRFKPGERVYAMLPNTEMGGYAEYALVDAESIAPIPTHLSFAQAAVVPCAALTALQALRDKAKLKAGDRVLVNGASGGVGSFAVQIARAMGAHVTGVTSKANLEFVRQLGASAVVDYTAGDVTQSEQRFDVIFDAVGMVPFARWKRILNVGGVAVTVNPILGSPLARWMARFNGGGRRWESLLVKPLGTDLKQLNTWLESGVVCPIIESYYPLEAVAEAHRRIESKRTRGKLVLIVDKSLMEG